MMLPKGRLQSQQAPPPAILVEGMDSNGGPVDKYTAGIELSNACRQFYVSRVKASAKVKERLGINDERRSLPTRGTARTGTGNARSRPTPSTPPQGGNATSPTSKPATTSIDSAMQVLKREMASLIDQDLALMGQLLTLNEQIEELKWQRKLRGYSRGSLESSCNLEASGFSMCTSSEACTTSNLDVPGYIPKYPSPSELSLYDPSPRASREADLPGNQLQPDVTSHTGSDFSRRVIRPEVMTTSTSDLGSSDDLPMEGTLPIRSNPGGERRGTHGRHGMTTPIVTTSTVTTSNTVVPHHSRGSQDQQSFDSGIHEPGHLIEILL